MTNKKTATPTRIQPRRGQPWRYLGFEGRYFGVVDRVGMDQVALTITDELFRKPGTNQVPITHEHGFKQYAGRNPIPAALREYVTYQGDQRKNLLSHWIYRQYASPVWMDIRRGRLMPFDDERDDPEEKHVCPLQLDVIERCLSLWSNPREVMLTPFMGVGSEVFQAVRMGRRAIGCELKGTYYRQAAENIDKAYLPEEDELPMCLNTTDDQGSMFNDDTAEWLNEVTKAELPCQSPDDDLELDEVES